MSILLVHFSQVIYNLDMSNVEVHVSLLVSSRIKLLFETPFNLSELHFGLSQF
jgi:hypothetical protein